MMMFIFQLFFLAMMFLIVRNRSAGWSKAWIYLTIIPCLIPLSFVLIGLTSISRGDTLGAAIIGFLASVTVVLLIFQLLGWGLALIVSKNDCSVTSSATVGGIVAFLSGGASILPLAAFDEFAMIGGMSSLLLGVGYGADVVLRGHMLNIMARRKNGTLDEPFVYPLEELMGIGGNTQSPQHTNVVPEGSPVVSTPTPPSPTNDAPDPVVVTAPEQELAVIVSEDREFEKKEDRSSGTFDNPYNFGN